MELIFGPIRFESIRYLLNLLWPLSMSQRILMLISAFLGIAIGQDTKPLLKKILLFAALMLNLGAVSAHESAGIAGGFASGFVLATGMLHLVFDAFTCPVAGFRCCHWRCGGSKPGFESVLVCGNPHNCRPADWPRFGTTDTDWKGPLRVAVR